MQQHDQGQEQRQRREYRAALPRVRQEPIRIGFIGHRADQGRIQGQHEVVAGLQRVRQDGPGRAGLAKVAATIRVLCPLTSRQAATRRQPPPPACCRS